MQIHFLKNQMNTLAGRCLSKTIRHVIRAQDNRDYVIDRIHGHLWFVSDTNEISERCACELYSATDRFKIEWIKMCFYLDNESEDEEKIEDKNDLFIREIYPKYLDHFHMRTNAFRTAIETAINLHLTSVSFF
jgi:hypothetical protein